MAVFLNSLGELTAYEHDGQLLWQARGAGRPAGAGLGTEVPLSANPAAVAGAGG